MELFHEAAPSGSGGAGHSTRWPSGLLWCGCSQAQSIPQPFGLHEVWENTALTDLCALIPRGKYWPYLPGFLKTSCFWWHSESPRHFLQRDLKMQGTEPKGNQSKCKLSTATCIATTCISKSFIYYIRHNCVNSYTWDVYKYIPNQE